MQRGEKEKQQTKEETKGRRERTQHRMTVTDDDDVVDLERSNEAGSQFVTADQIGGPQVVINAEGRSIDRFGKFYDFCFDVFD